jgi:hypothetical protein
MGFEETTRHKGEDRLISSGFIQRVKQNALFLSVRPDSKTDSNGPGSSCVDTPRHFFGSRRILGALVALNGLGEGMEVLVERSRVTCAVRLLSNVK